MRQLIAALLAVVVLGGDAAATLRTNNATSDRIDFGTTGSTDYTAVSFAGWWYPTSLLTNRNLVSKWKSSAPQEGVLLRLTGTTGNLQVLWNATTQNMLRTTTDTPFAVLNKWYFVAASADTAGASGSQAVIYVGDEQTPATARSGTSQDVIAPTSAGSAASFVLGNQGPTTNNNAFPGLVGIVAFFGNHVITLEEARAFQRNWRAPIRQSALRVLAHAGSNGTGLVWDLSGTGNHGTNSGGVPTTDVIPRVTLRR